MLEVVITKNRYYKYSNNFLNLAEKVEKELDIKENNIFDVTFVNDKKIQEINNKYRKINKPTDVISFALNDTKKIKSVLLGEIFISIDTARKEAVQSGKNIQKIIDLLFVHGLLHLLGFDHSNKKEEKAMFSLQDKILK